MPPAYLRAPSVLRQAAPAAAARCAHALEPMSRKAAKAKQRRTGRLAFDCSHCGHWHTADDRHRWREVR